MSAYFFKSLCSLISQGIISPYLFHVFYHATFNNSPWFAFDIQFQIESRYTGTTIRDRINSEPWQLARPKGVFWQTKTVNANNEVAL